MKIKDYNAFEYIFNTNYPDNQLEINLFEAYIYIYFKKINKMIASNKRWLHTILLHCNKLTV